MRKKESRFGRIKATFSRAARKVGALLGRRASEPDPAPPRRDYGFGVLDGEKDGRPKAGTAGDGSGDGGVPKRRPRKADGERQADKGDERNTPDEKPEYKDYSIPPNLTPEELRQWEENQKRLDEERLERERRRRERARREAREREARRLRRQRAAAASRAKQGRDGCEVMEPREPRDKGRGDDGLGLG